MISVGVFVFTNASNVFLVGISIWELCNTLKTYASAADAMECRSVFHSTNITPFLKNMPLVCGVFVR